MAPKPTLPTGMPRSRSSSLTDLVEQAQMLHALGLGDEQRRQAGPHRRLDVGNGQPHRPVDAHGDVGAAARHLLHRLGQHGARLGLLRRLHAVLEIDQHAVRAALVRLVDELGHIARHVEDRAPDGRRRARSLLLPFEMTPAWQSLSYSASPSSGFSSASLCSPIFGAAASQRAGRAGHARHHRMRRQLAHLLVGNLDQRLALQHVVVLHDLGDVVDRADGDAGLVEDTSGSRRDRARR